MVSSLLLMPFKSKYGLIAIALLVAVIILFVVIKSKGE